MKNQPHSNQKNSLLASFRDPAGRLFRIDGEIIRVVNRAGAEDLNAFLSSAACKKFLNAGQIPRTEFLNGTEAAALLKRPEIREVSEEMEGAVFVRHEEIPFPSYPYEWTPEMLHAAGLMTLDFAEALLAEGLGLKDATPYNLLFRGPSPVFVDLLSFERRDPADPLWLAAAQFERTFLLPLLVNRQFGIPLHQLLASRRDGLEPEDVYRLCGPLRRLAPDFLTMSSIPTWLAAKQNQDDASIYQKKRLANREKAEFILTTVYKRLRRLLRRVEPKGGQASAWSNYLSSNNNYSEAHFQAKCALVERVVAEFRPQKVLDIGCNTGHFSAIAARGGARVVAVDYDPVVAGAAWRMARSEKLDILPLVVDVSRPSPAIGWRNRECAAFLERARGNFDAVFMLALIHHLLVSERIPLAEIIELAAELTTGVAVIEYIAPDDSMFRRLTRGRDHLFVGLTTESFEAACRRHFAIIQAQHQEGTSRWLYVLRKKEMGDNA